MKTKQILDSSIAYIHANIRKKGHYIVLGFAWETDNILGHTYAEIIKIQKG